jgi:hypothetical protein
VPPSTTFFKRITGRSKANKMDIKLVKVTTGAVAAASLLVLVDFDDIPTTKLQSSFWEECPLLSFLEGQSVVNG